MRRLFILAVLTACVAVPSFAGDVVGHSAKVAGKASVKVVTVTAKDGAKAIGRVGKFLF